MSKVYCVYIKDVNNSLKYTVRNSLSMASILKDLTICKEDRMASFDVVSLFTNVSVDLAEEVVENLAKKNKEICVKIPIKIILRV